MNIQSPLGKYAAAALDNDAANEIVVEFRDVTKTYSSKLKNEQKLAVNHINLQVYRGEVVCLMGTSGSGKSTLLRHVNRLIDSSSGHVFIEGQDISQLNPKLLRELRAKRIGMVFQHFGLLPHRTVIENVAFPLELDGVPEVARFAAAREQLKAVGLEGWDNHYPHELSGGMQQRVGFARALITQPDILLMDEPFSALDPTIRRSLQYHFLKLVRERGITTLFVTHDPSEALRLADRIAVMRHGQLVQVASPNELLAIPADAEIAKFFQDYSSSPVRIAALVTSTDPAVTDIPSPGSHDALARWKTLLLGPAALAEYGKGGLFWLTMAIELAAISLIVQGLLSDIDLWLSGLLLVIASRFFTLSVIRRSRQNPHSGWKLPLSVLLFSQIFVIWRALTSEIETFFFTFPVDRLLFSETAQQIDNIIDWSQNTFESAFVGIIVLVRTVIESIEAIFGWLPWPVSAVALIFLSWRAAGFGLSLLSTLSIIYIGLFGFWERTISTLALVGSSVIIVLILGIPLGILVAKKSLARKILTPILDIMQTLPTFVYLIPAVAFFSIGKTPAVIATVVFSLAPMIRLTALGLQEVPKESVEAAIAHGANPWQVLTKVQLPLARHSLLLGINQTIVMSLSMVVVAALIGAGGLGYDVMAALRNIKGGEGVLAGIAIVLCALIPDRIIQSKLHKQQ
ncbi:ATP-binding cassette domain-containing protein [Providencia vermicola]|uniref:ATP-binding cassette domain-containing protein n=1 Tax=Providencia vermicola TaxID=333965 RepID=UPI0032DB2819